MMHGLCTDDALMMHGMHVSMILDPDACFYDAANFVTDERTNGQGDSRSWIAL